MVRSSSVGILRETDVIDCGSGTETVFFLFIQSATNRYDNKIATLSALFDSSNQVESNKIKSNPLDKRGDLCNPNHISYFDAMALLSLRWQFWHISHYLCAMVCWKTWKRIYNDRTATCHAYRRALYIIINYYYQLSSKCRIMFFERHLCADGMECNLRNHGTNARTRDKPTIISTFHFMYDC